MAHSVVDAKKFPTGRLTQNATSGSPFLVAYLCIFYFLCPWKYRTWMALPTVLITTFSANFAR